MLHEAPIAMHKAPHVIVVGNEKGGSKTTIAMHIAIMLLKDGQRVGTIDLDSNQKSLTRYVENRCIWAKHRGIAVETPIHRYVPRTEGGRLEENEAAEWAAFQSVIASFNGSVDFLVVDTPAHDSYLMRLAHLVADTVLTPLNDSFLDFGSSHQSTQSLMRSSKLAITPQWWSRPVDSGDYSIAASLIG